MRRVIFLLLLSFAVFFFILCKGVYAAVDPKWTNLNKYLFVDNAIVDTTLSSSQTSYTTKINRPSQYQEVIKPEANTPWEANGYHYFSNVLDYNRAFNGTTYKYILYYRRAEARDNPNTSVVETDEGGVYCVALSNDGVSWIRPIFNGSSKYNGSNTNCINIDGPVSFVLKDPNGPDAQRFKMFRPDMWYDTNGEGQGGFGVVGVSSDGLQFTPVQKRLGPVNTALTGTPAYGFDTQNTPVWDSALGGYRFYMRGWNGILTPRGRWTYNRRSVNYGQVVGTNLMDQDVYFLESSNNPNPYQKNGSVKVTSEIPPIMETTGEEICKWIRGYTDCTSNPLTTTEDRAAVDIYHTAAIKYPFATNTYLSFPTLYFHYTDSQNPGKKLSGNDGEFEPQFAASRDGANWTRYKRIDGYSQYIDRGTYPRGGGSINMRMISMGQGMIGRGNEIFQYFIALPRTHGGGFWYNNVYKDIAGDMCGTQSCQKVWYAGYKGGVFLAKQRLDGFASVGTTNSTTVATVVTHPLTFTGNKLRLNGKTSGTGGYIKVSLLTESGSEVPGYELSASTPLTGDFTDGQAIWATKTELGSLQGSTIRLKFELKNAQLFAFSFTGPGGPTATPTPSRSPTPSIPITATVTPTHTPSPTPFTSSSYVVDTQQFISQSLGNTQLLMGYWVIVRNTGDTTIDSLALTDMVSAGTRIISVSQPEGVIIQGISAEQVSMNISNLEPHGTRTIMLFTLVPKGDPACPGSNTVEYPAPDGSGPLRVSTTGDSSGCVIQ